MKIERKYLYLFGIAIIAIAVFYFISPYITGRFVSVDETDEEDKMVQFAECLAEKGIVMYGAKYCGHCTNQKEMFGDAFEHVDYVECTEQVSLCQTKGVSSIPAWEIDGKFYVGERSLESLSSLSGCPLE